MNASRTPARQTLTECWKLHFSHYVDWYCIALRPATLHSSALNRATSVYPERVVALGLQQQIRSHDAVILNEPGWPHTTHFIRQIREATTRTSDDIHVSTTLKSLTQYAECIINN